MKSLELDWVSILENGSFKDYHKDRFRLFFELKGLGSLGRPKENYIKKKKFMKFYFLMFFAFIQIIFSFRNNFIDRIAIIVDEGIIMESELNDALEQYNK